MNRKIKFYNISIIFSEAFCYLAKDFNKLFGVLPKLGIDNIIQTYQNKHIKLTL